MKLLNWILAFDSCLQQFPSRFLVSSQRLALPASSKDYQAIPHGDRWRNLTTLNLGSRASTISIIFTSVS